MRKLLLVIGIGVWVLGGGQEGQAQGLVDVQGGGVIAEIQRRGFLICGTNNSVPSFGGIDETGRWIGFDVDFCKAVAAVVLGDPEAVQFIALTSSSRLEALRVGDVDLLSRNTTITFRRDAGTGLSGVSILYYDGQGVAVPKDLGITTLDAFPAGGTICVQSDTTTRYNLETLIADRGLDITLMQYRSGEESRRTFFSGGCTGYSGDRTSVAGTIYTEAPDPERFMLLDDVLSKEPLGPLVREGDPVWFKTIRWTANGLIAAEEAGITAIMARRVDQRAKAAEATGSEIDLTDLEGWEDTIPARRLMGIDPGLGTPLGFDDAWLRRAIMASGNYGEMFERNMGMESDLKLSRGLNDLWSRGGLHYAMPM